MQITLIRHATLVLETSLGRVHLEAINHCLESREVYRQLDGVLAPADGETLEL